MVWEHSTPVMVSAATGCKVGKFLADLSHAEIR